jgi:DNA-binding PadR family transcriptional regulator
MGETPSDVAVLSWARIPDRPGRSRSGAGEEAPATGTEELPSEGRAADVQPSLEELRISARILLYISRQPRFAAEELFPESLTQGGIAKALGTSVGAASNALRRLVYGGLVEVRQSHVRRMMRRLKVYQLTERGEEAVRHFHKRFGP